MSRNKQNDTVNEHMAKAGMASRMLQSLGLTVLNVSGIGERPLIHIYPGRGCQQLQSGYTKHTVRDGHRVTERVAMVSDCQVRWEERS